MVGEPGGWAGGRKQWAASGLLLSVSLCLVVSLSRSLARCLCLFGLYEYASPRRKYRLCPVQVSFWRAALEADSNRAARLAEAARSFLPLITLFSISAPMASSLLITKTHPLPLLCQLPCKSHVCSVVRTFPHTQRHIPERHAIVLKGARRQRHLGLVPSRFAALPHCGLVPLPSLNCKATKQPMQQQLLGLRPSKAYVMGCGGMCRHLPWGREQ